MGADKDLLDGCLILCWFWSVPIPEAYEPPMQALTRHYDVIPNDHRVERATRWLLNVHAHAHPGSSQSDPMNASDKRQRLLTVLNEDAVFQAADANWNANVTALMIRAGLSFEEMQVAVGDQDRLDQVRLLAALQDDPDLLAFTG